MTQAICFAQIASIDYYKINGAINSDVHTPLLGFWLLALGRICKFVFTVANPCRHLFTFSFQSPAGSCFLSFLSHKHRVRDDPSSLARYCPCPPLPVCICRGAADSRQPPLPPVSLPLRHVISSDDTKTIVQSEKGLARSCWRRTVDSVRRQENDIS